MIASLLRLQTLAFWRAPYLGGRLALAAVKGFGVAYAVVSAAIIGFVLPDLLGAVAPDLAALPLVEQSWLPAMAGLTAVRILFQEVPTRGATAFLTLPVSRRRVAWGVLLRSVPSPLNAVPLAFAVPFAARAVQTTAGPAAALRFGGAVLATVVLSHALLVVWKTRLGAQPARTVGLVAALGLAVAALDVATGGLVAHVRAGGALALAALAALAAGTLAVGYRGLVGALYLDAAGARRQRVRPGGAFAAGGTRAFVDLTLRLVTRATFPRGIVVNGVLVSLALTAFVVLRDAGTASDLILVFSAGPVAGSLGQYAVPFASGYYDRLVTLPGAWRDFVRSQYAVIAGGTLGLGVLQAALVLALDPSRLGLVGASVLFSLGVLAPAALWGSSLGPKPVDVTERLMFNYKAQSFGAQAAVAATALVAGAALALAGPARGAALAALLGGAGVLAAPLWLAGFARRLHRTRHSISARFRADL